MKLGIITYLGEKNNIDELITKVKKQKLDFIEIGANGENDDTFYLENAKTIIDSLNKNDLTVGSCGRWGTDRIKADGSVNEEEFKKEERLVEFCNMVGCPVYVLGCNYIEELSLYENCTAAIGYFTRLIEVGKKYNVKIAVYNCRWNNFVNTDFVWEIILGHLKDLYIKYDPSHSIYHGVDYIKETNKWGSRFAHVHVKGALHIDGERIDDPPAGMDMINWAAFISLLYVKGYDGTLSIEPHSEIWKDEKGEKGVEFTIKHIRQFLM